MQELHARLGKLVEAVESGREAVLASHRTVLDYTDSSIARVSSPKDCSLPQNHRPLHVWLQKMQAQYSALKPRKFAGGLRRTLACSVLRSGKDLNVISKFI